MHKPEELKSAIEKALPGSLAKVEDTTGTGDHFQAVVVAPQFAGKSRVQQHQLVYRALSEAIEGDLHALGLKTFTPEDWEREQSSTG